MSLNQRTSLIYTFNVLSIESSCNETHAFRDLCFVCICSVFRSVDLRYIHINLCLHVHINTDYIHAYVSYDLHTQKTEKQKKNVIYLFMFSCWFYCRKNTHTQQTCDTSQMQTHPHIERNMWLYVSHWIFLHKFNMTR